MLLRAFVVDVVLCDLGLPDGSGRDLRKFLPAHLPPAVTLIISGDARPEEVKKSLDAGFVAHFEKPIDFDLLQDTVEKLLGRGF